MTWRLLFSIAAMGAVGCSDLPKDSEGTLQRIRSERVFRVGIIAPSADQGRQRRLIEGVAKAANARPHVEGGASEALLARLETGEIDLVLGTLAKDSPWSKRVTLLPPLEPAVEGESKSALKLHAVARNGENAWIELLHREAEAVSKAGA